MKAVLLILMISITAHAQASKSFCYKKAEDWMNVLHQRVLEDTGVIQGYHESMSYEVKTKRHAMDNLTETYTFTVDAQNDEGDTWAWVYKVEVEVWLKAGGTPRYCDVMKARFEGALETDF